MKYLIFILFPVISLSVSSQIITTIAGNGTPGYSGDGGPATSAQLSSLYQVNVAFDNSGNFYIPMAGVSSNVIRKVNSAGIISTIAGTGPIGYSGDGGLAIFAALYHPSNIIVDNSGNIIFADQNGSVIRKISPSGIITTIAGVSTGSTCTGDGGLFSLATFNTISGMVMDVAGNIYISDQGCHTIRKVNTSGIITTIAGNGTPGFSGDGGPATSAQLLQPFQVGFDNIGNIYIPANNRIRKVNTAGIITTIAGTGGIGFSGNGGPAILAEFDGTASVCVDHNGNIYVADYYNSQVRKIDNAGIITAFAGNGIFGYSGDGGPATLAQITEPHNINFDGGDNMFIVDYFNYAIRKVGNCLTATVTTNPLNVILCNSGNANFSITATNANSYQWQENTGSGWNNLIDNAVYSGTTTNILNVTGATTGMNGFQYRCVVTNSCGNIYSLAAILTVNTPTAPAINIVASATNICTGTNTIFTATPVNGGNSPAYQWRKNGIPVGSNSNTYSDNGLINGDIISCLLTSNSTCLTTNTATSNNIVMTVSPLLTPGITISASQNGFCYGTLVGFSSASIHPGSNPVYQWKKNGINVGANSGIYTDNTLQNGDVISCVLISSEYCLTVNNVVSNAIFMNVMPLVTPSITINASGTSICRGNTVIFNASFTYGGSGPVLQWKKNGINVGTNSPVYTDNTILNGDIITCNLTSNANCLSTAGASSNPILITVNPDPVVSLNKNTGICTGSTKVLDAGPFSAYLWNDGSANRTLTISTPGTYYVTVTDSHGCKASDTSKLTTLLPLPGNFLPADSSICPYADLTIQANPGYSTYLWYNGSTGTGINITSPGLYWLEVVDNNQCKGRDSIRILPRQCLKGLFIPNTFTPNGDAKNDIFKAFLYGTIKQFELRIINRYGETVFYTKDINQGWDGRFKGVLQNTGVFTWFCSYQIDRQMPTVEKGTVLLLR